MELVREATRHTAGALPSPMPLAPREAPAITTVAKSYIEPRRSVAIVPLQKRLVTA
jgi:hypothetical protein